MPRLKVAEPARAEGPAKEMLEAVQGKLGRVPNIFKGMAASPAVLGGYLAFSEALSKSSLPASVREQIALAVAQDNSCDYCLAAHSAIGRMQGLSEEDVSQARRGKARDRRAAAAVTLARKIVQARGDLTDADVAHARRDGLDDAALAEVVAVTSLNLFTNYFNHLNNTEVDFPPAPKMD